MHASHRESSHHERHSLFSKQPRNHVAPKFQTRQPTNPLRALDYPGIPEGACRDEPVCGRRSLEKLLQQRRTAELGPSALQQTSFKEEALANASAEGSAAVWVGDESVHRRPRVIAMAVTAVRRPRRHCG